VRLADASTKALEGLLDSNFEEVQGAAEGGRLRRHPVLLMHSTDLPC